MINDHDFESINSLYLHQEKDKSNDHGIGYKEFIALMTGEHRYTPGEGEPDILKLVSDTLRSKIVDGGTTMRNAFAAADTNNSGTLEKSEMKEVFRLYHIDCDNQEFSEFFSDYDTNRDGKFSYQEFVGFLMAKLDC